jgi:hypothetical protein
MQIRGWEAANSLKNNHIFSFNFFLTNWLNPRNPAFHPMGGLATAISESIRDLILYIAMISDDVLPTCSNTMADALLKMDDNLHNMKRTQLPFCLQDIVRNVPFLSTCTIC